MKQLYFIQSLMFGLVFSVLMIVSLPVLLLLF